MSNKTPMCWKKAIKHCNSSLSKKKKKGTSRPFPGSLQRHSLPTWHFSSKKKNPACFTVNNVQQSHAEDEMQERFFFFPWMNTGTLLGLEVAFFSPHTSLRAACVLGDSWRSVLLNVSCDNGRVSELPAARGDPANLSFVISAVNEVVNQHPSWLNAGLKGKRKRWLSND